MTALKVIGIGLAVVFAVGFGVWRLGRRTGFFLHLLQLDGYKRHEYTAWIRTNRRGLVVRLSHVLAAVVLSVGTVLLYAGLSSAAAVVVLVCWPVVFASSRRYRRAATKKPFAPID